MESCARSSLQQASIGQCFIHAIRPRSTLPPILFELAVEMDYVFRSRWQVDHLSKLGYSLSFYEVTRYKQSVIENENASDWLKRMMLGSFCHWIADNVDHNVRTNQDLPKIPRTKVKKVGKLIQKKGTPILSHVQPDVSGLSKLSLKAYDQGCFT